VKPKAAASAAKPASTAKPVTRSAAKAAVKTAAKAPVRKTLDKTNKAAPQAAMKKTGAPATSAKSAKPKPVTAKPQSKKIADKQTAGKQPPPAKVKTPAAPAKSVSKTAKTLVTSAQPTIKKVAPKPGRAVQDAAQVPASKASAPAPTRNTKAAGWPAAAPLAVSVYSMPARVINTPHPVPIKKNPRLADNWKTKPVEQWSDEEVIAMPDDEYMNNKQQAFFRLRLLTLKQDLLSNAGETTENLRGDTVVVPDPADRATIEEEHALELRTRDRERKLLKKIEQSIARIDAGDYGYCDETGEPIGIARLLARPTATLSLEAQQRRELKQKLFGD
jgi:DnaK suppressor protein